MKKYLLVFLLLVSVLPFVVNAETCDPSSVQFESIELIKTNGNAEEITDASVSGRKLNLDLKFYDPGDSFEYTLKVKNTSKEDFYFDDDSLKLNTNYLEYELIYEDNSNIIEALEEKTIKLKIEYKNKVQSELLVNDVFNDTNNMTVYLSNKDIIDIPNTYKNLNTLDIIMIIILAFLVCTGMYLIVFKSGKSKKYMILIIGIALVVPINVNALCKCQIDVEAKIQIDGKEAIFLSGSLVNVKMKQLAGTIINSTNQGTSDANIKAIKYSKNEPNDSNKEDKNIVSLPESPYPIYMWFDNGTIYWWSEDKTPSLNADASYMFHNLHELIELETKYFDSSQSTNMSNLFSETGYSREGINYSFDNLDTSNVTDMSGMFSHFAFYNETQNFDLNDWNISKVTNMSEMFKSTGYYSKELNIDLHEWDISSVQNLDNMFDGAGWYSDIFTLNIEGWDLRNYKKDSSYKYNIFGSAGYAAKESIVNLNNLKIGKNKPDFYSFLSNSKDIKVYMNNWVFDGTTDISQMLSNVFRSNSNSQTSKYIEAKYWDISKITSTNSLLYQFCMGGTDSTHIDLTGWKLSKDTPVDRIFYDIALYSKNSYIDLTDWDLGDITNLQYMFYYVAENNESATVNLTGWDTSKVTDMSHMFHNGAIFTNNINIIGLEDLNTSKVTNMEYMFSEFALNAEINWDLSKWDVSHVTKMNNMFFSVGRQAGDKSSTLDLSNWDVSSVTEASRMFNSMINLRKIYATSDWEFTSVTNPNNIEYFFYMTPQIVGGNGTTYQGVYDTSMAKIDREGVPGFFTLKE